MTRLEKLRCASDEEVAKTINWIAENSLVYCKQRIDCEDDLNEGREIPFARCSECLLEYLRGSDEGGADG